MKNQRSKIKNSVDGPIGVFDSGLGGLTVVKALRQQLPDEPVVYFGDTARVPYGTKSRESIIRFSEENVAILLKYKVQMVVVACNSSTSHALSVLQRTFDLPIIGVISPGVRKALQVTKNKRIGIIATPATINSQAYARQILDADPSVKVIGQPCPLFVPLVEEGWFNRPVTRTVAQEYLSKVKKFNVDTLILGCTHYPLLKSVIAKVMGPQVALIDSAQEVAGEVKELLQRRGNGGRRNEKKSYYEFLVSDDPKHFSRLAKKFLGFEIKAAKRVG